MKMRWSLPVSFALLAVCGFGAWRTAASSDRRLFDGRTLDGWEADAPFWSVRDHEIVGRMGPLKENHFLCTKQRFADFELSVSVLLEGQGWRNSGVQFRSERVPQSTEVAGYQADVGPGYWGALYDESRRDRILAGPPDDVLATLVREGAWNRYRIVASGSHIEIYLNDVRTVSYDEQDSGIARSGRICLQLHAGSGIGVRFRDFHLATAAGERS